MFVSLMKGKIHRATVTEANLNYVGSITIDALLMEKAGFFPNEEVQVVSVTTGARLNTYVIPGASGSGIIALNGAAARWFAPGDIVIIIAYAWMSEEEARVYKPRVVFVNEKNEITATSTEEVNASQV
ncbi:MAG: aspartate 1-decarboxylase [Candidatus Carbobacillus altaicus]|uniref:Aspartate 1-decarboxylase n=1 Tax=Candidatus Carbonibacillus altaicus TaxID=2163959 RepID=A0A2R6Y2R8_9BACL|nr:aspartate 1-decarboxylase [Candidatus Carbobacillus altaicus]PTQ56932.1 MAG: Aspartate 1-decarboxylase [Candidatus Carbobacillus altaicus]